MITTALYWDDEKNLRVVKNSSKDRSFVPRLGEKLEINVLLKRTDNNSTKGNPSLFSSCCSSG